MRNLKIIFALTTSFYVSTGSAKVSVSTLIPSGFQTIEEEIASALFTQYPAMFRASCDEGDQDSYRCGELPLGTIQDENTKSLFNITIPQQSFNHDGFKGTFPAMDLDINMSRQQRGDVSIPEKLIGDDREIRTSNYFGRDIYVKLNSANNKMGGTACIYVPGVKTKISSATSKFTAKKKFLFISMKSKVTTKISFAEGSFDAIKTCLGFQVLPKVDPTKKTLTYDYKLIGQSKPVFVNLIKGKATVDVSVKGGNFLGSIVNLFAGKMIAKQIKAEIEKKISKEVDNIYEEDVTSGKWFSKYINGSFNVKTVKNLSELLSKSLSKPYTPNMSVLGESYASVCNKFSRQILSNLNDKMKEKITDPLNAFCDDFQDLKTESFIKNSSSAQSGCYSRAMRPTTEADPIIKPRLNPVARECRFDHRLTVNVDPLFKGLGKCLIEQWKYRFNDPCDDEIADLLKTLLPPF